MSENSAITELVSVLLRHGYEHPELTKDGFTETFLFRSTELSIEIEHDHRERALFVLLVRMENGEVPDGYYCNSRGVLSRIHLNKALTKIGVPVKKYGQLSVNKQSEYLAAGLNTLLNNVPPVSVSDLFR